MVFTPDSSPLKKALTAPIKVLLVSAMLIIPAAPAYADDDATIDRVRDEVGRLTVRFPVYGH